MVFTQWFIYTKIRIKTSVYQIAKVVLKDGWSLLTRGLLTWRYGQKKTMFQNCNSGPKNHVLYLVIRLNKERKQETPLYPHEKV